MKEKKEPSVEAERLSSIPHLKGSVKEVRDNLQKGRATWQEAEELMSLVKESQVLRLHPEAHLTLTNTLYLLTNLFGATFPRAILKEAEISKKEKGERLKEILLFAKEFAANKNNPPQASAMLIFCLLPWCFHQPTQQLLLKTLSEEERIKLEEALLEKIRKGGISPPRRELNQRLVGELEWGPKAVIQALSSHYEVKTRNLARKALSLTTYFKRRQPLYSSEGNFIADLERLEVGCLQLIIPPAPRTSLLSSLSPLPSVVPPHPEEELFLIQDRHLPLYLCLSGISFKFADK